ncbi:MAG: HEAT repeat domain-containing protein [Desulfatiglandales bacterium]
MKCSQISELLPDHIIGALEEPQKLEVRQHLESCDACSKEAASLEKIWTKLEALPVEQPSGAVRERFYTMLSAYHEGLSHSKERPKLRDVINGWIERWWPSRPAVQVGFAAALLLIGVFVGTRLQPGPAGNSEIAMLRQDISTMRQLVTLSLLRQDSPSERLRGVSFGAKVENPNDEILNALLSTLNSDPNVNVRLAAIDALFMFSSHPQVKSGLIGAIAEQRSPMIQIELIELLVKSGEKSVVDTLRLLLENEEVNPAVKERAQWGIEQLI